MRKFVFYNPRSGNGGGFKAAKRLSSFYPDCELIYRDVTSCGYDELMRGISSCDDIILCGGDGTLNRFINDIRGKELFCDIYYYGTGSGNDFLNDLEKPLGSEPFIINGYISHLPSITVNGAESYMFADCAGAGFDGLICGEGNRHRETSDKPLNYVFTALYNLIFNFKPMTASVSVDGKKYEFSKVWMAPVMNGRFFGGGMMMAPMQSRADGLLTCVVVHDASKLRVLRAFPYIFSGKHIRFKKIITVLRGSDISVTLSRKCELQLDGETFTDVSSYRVTKEKKASLV